MWIWDHAGACVMSSGVGGCWGSSGAHRAAHREMESNKSVLKTWGNKRHLQQCNFSSMVASANGLSMFTYTDTGLSGTEKSSSCDCICVWYTALLPGESHIILYLLQDSSGWIAELQYRCYAKRASSPAHKASLKRLQIPEITHLSPGRGLGASGHQLSKKRKLQRVGFRPRGVPHRDGSRGLAAAVGRAGAAASPWPQALQLGAKSIPFLRVIQMEMENHLKMRGMGVGEVNTCYYKILFNGKEKKMHL